MVRDQGKLLQESQQSRKKLEAAKLLDISTKFRLYQFLEDWQQSTDTHMNVVLTKSRWVMMGLPLVDGQIPPLPTRVQPADDQHPPVLNSPSELTLVTGEEGSPLQDVSNGSNSTFVDDTDRQSVADSIWNPWAGESNQERLSESSSR
ncbi:hypothetical protein BD311DRAFT_775967 [Dichomitus squalens]|uniref:Uncharacterized protein n=1 Tax=Dichomitus squalens TaxID=114155 RepID=A0A4V2K172_9APHY|nr:hypothetical protein BD311DRAFT_775967 [Dichomitus squalens]